MRIAAPHLANLLEFSSFLGYNEAVLRKSLANADLDLSLFENSISEAELISVYNQLLKGSGDGYFGLRYGCFLNIKAMGLVFAISKATDNIEQTIVLLMKFMEGTFPAFKFVTTEKGETITIEVLCDIWDPVVRRHLSDCTLCVMYRELRLITNMTCEIRIHFPFKNIRTYKKMLGGDVRKGNSYALVLNKKQINESLNTKNNLFMAELLPSFLHLIEKTKRKKSFSSLVRKMMLNMSEPELPGFVKVVSQFAMSERSFQRKLKSEGSSFRKIADEIKCELSIFLKRSKNRKTQEIAYLLGYSEPSAYLHAVKKWETT
jgi:AraC-like DNA-binding protein